MRVLIADSFLGATSRLDLRDAKRVALFLEKIVSAPDAAGMRPEIVHDAADRSIRSFKVTHDLRALAHVDGENVLLLHVARHDRAYAWAKDRCVRCQAETGEQYLVGLETSDQGEHIRAHHCAGREQLCELMASRGIYLE